MSTSRTSRLLSGLLATTLLPLAGCVSDGTDGASGANTADQVVSIQRVGRSASQGFGVSAAEIVAYDSAGRRVFTVNAQSGKVDDFSIADVTAPALQESLDLRAMLVNAGDPHSSIGIDTDLTTRFFV